MNNQVVDLNGAWALREAGGAWTDVQVPNSVYCNLAEAGRLELSDVENNPENHAWVADAHWEYKKTFDCPAGLLATKRIELVFEGLDSIASVYLNGEPLGGTENMHVEHRFDVGTLLKPEDNELTVAFEPVREYAERRRREHPIEGINTTRSYVRKAQYVYGWDWCPPLEGCGIWKAVHLEGVDRARIESIYAHTLEIGDGWADLQIEVELDAVVDGSHSCTYSLSGDGGAGTLDFPAGQTRAETVLRIQDPELWWPVGYGEAHLQTLEVSLLEGGETLDRRSVRFGIRTVELDTSPDEHGHRHRFVVNGRPVYIKGANWVPASMFPGSVSAERYRALIDSALDANMNTLRIWGGGYYEDKAFYDHCDETGMMVWQEFMFACAYYPDEPWFHGSVREEAAQQIRRLRNHPCKIIWCGNNECDWIHWEFWSKETPTFHGERIYHELLPAQIERHEPGAVYVPSSPIATREGVNPNEPHSGDTHDWAVWNFQKPISEYLVDENRISRMATEFGLHALPNFESVKLFCPENELRVGSRSLDKHNYQEDNARIYRYIGELFAMPRNLEEFCYLSQLVQARAVGMHCEYLRAHNHRNHGILFWQFNDAVPCIGWSAIDFHNRPKALLHYAKRFYADVVVTAVPHPPRRFNPDMLGSHREPLRLRKISAVNDSGREIPAELRCTLLDLGGGIVDTLRAEAVLPPHGRFDLGELPEGFRRPEAADSRILALELVAEGKTIAENTFLYVPDKHIVWPEPKIKKKLSRADGKTLLRLSSDVVVKDLQISLGPDIRPSDNYFDLLPGREYTVALEGESSVNIDPGRIRLRSVQTCGNG